MTIRSVTFALTRPERLPVGHTVLEVAAVEFSHSRRGWLRGLGSVRPAETTDPFDANWIDVSGDRPLPDWLEQLTIAALPFLPRALRTAATELPPQPTDPAYHLLPARRILMEQWEQGYDVDAALRGLDRVITDLRLAARTETAGS